MSSLLSKTSWQNTKQLFAYRGKQNNKCCYSLKIWVSDLWNICRYIVEKKNENWANIYIYIIEYRATHFHITEERMLLDQQKLLAINLLLLALDGHVSCLIFNTNRCLILIFTELFFGVGYSHLKVVSRQRGDSVNGQHDNDALYGFCSFWVKNFKQFLNSSTKERENPLSLRWFKPWLVTT